MIISVELVFLLSFGIDEQYLLRSSGGFGGDAFGGQFAPGREGFVSRALFPHFSCISSLFGSECFNVAIVIVDAFGRIGLALRRMVPRCISRWWGERFHVDLVLINEPLKKSVEQLFIASIVNGPSNHWTLPYSIWLLHQYFVHCLSWPLLATVPSSNPFLDLPCKIFEVSSIAGRWQHGTHLFYFRTSLIFVSNVFSRRLMLCELCDAIVVTKLLSDVTLVLLLLK